MNHNAATDAEMIAALEASPNFTTVTDGAHLAELLGMTTEVADTPAERAGTDADAKMNADIVMIRAIITARIAKRAKWGGMANVTVAQVWNWWECEPYGAVAVERAVKSLIADGTVEETRFLGALAFDALS